ncbi:TIGR02117 family protein [Mucilaginibacter myungsuensis]|uniref:TIGR02117 family protein n=2 Tax=Mucilaginibacter myungsuensis TaxID=649104 RepID=A0A929KZB3_9SPHI|nr:TIGR02117 family protein [Mucilaginibacter myungsuensis]
MAYLLPHFGTVKEPGTSNDVAIYILTNGVHTDIVVPVKNEQMDWSKEVKFENTKSRDTTGDLLAFGWGDKGFYLNTPTWAQLKFSVAFKAATGLSTSAMHTTFYRDLVESPDCKKIMISKAQYARLIAYIQNSFQVDNEGHVMLIPTTANYNNFDAFYETKRRYNIFYTCNTWANNALKAAGQKAAIWTPSDKGIFWQYRAEK